MSIGIRLMRSDDYQPAYELWDGLPGIGLSSADTRTALLSFLDRNPETCFIAEDGGRLVGTILGGSDGRRGYIYHLAVDSSYQKRGIGRELVRVCLQALRDQGIEKCHIFVIADNREGQAFWQKEGWQLRDDILVMSKNLK
jgi:ribosomal protein S18 acetylase RimI-like enzyme